jgi:hypothetical protein
MQPTDKAAFAAVLIKTWRFYDKTPDREQLADWFDLLAEVSLAAVATAFKQHLADPKHGSFIPKPADIFRHVPTVMGDDGHPGADEAWGLLVRLIRDERETGVLTEEMRAAWATCQPILDLGDEVGARMAFRETYSRHLEKTRKIGVSARWTVTLGTDPALRQTRLTEAVQARRIGMDAVAALLPGPTPASVSPVAGWLAGPDASAQQGQSAAGLRQLAQILRNGSDHAAQRLRQREAEPHDCTLAAEQWRFQDGVDREPCERDAVAARIRKAA